MDTSLAQGTKKMMPIVETVHNCTKVPGGIDLATINIQTSTVSSLISWGEITQAVTEWVW